MSDEMIERVALAIWSERSEIPGGIPSEEYICMARAAIAAMREPTEAMLVAMFQAWEVMHPSEYDNSDMTPNWQAAIDAALVEK